MTRGLLPTLRTVAAALFGVRSAARHHDDGKALSPLVVVITAVIFMSIFVGILVTLATQIAGH